MLGPYPASWKFYKKKSWNWKERTSFYFVNANCHLGPHLYTFNLISAFKQNYRFIKMSKNPKPSFKPLCKGLFSCGTKRHSLWVFLLIPTMLRNHSVLYVLEHQYLKTAILRTLDIWSVCCIFGVFLMSCFLLLYDQTNLLIFLGDHSWARICFSYSWETQYELK